MLFFHVFFYHYHYQTLGTYEMMFQSKLKCFVFLSFCCFLFWMFRFSWSTSNVGWTEEPGCWKQWLRWVYMPRWQTRWTASRSQTHGPACTRWTEPKADLILHHNNSTWNVWCTLTALAERQLKMGAQSSVSHLSRLLLTSISKHPV